MLHLRNINLSATLKAGICVITCVLFSGAAMAADAPSIGGGAKIAVTVDEAGIINAGVGAEGEVEAKQDVGSVISGDIGGQLDIVVGVGEGGVLNVGAGAEGKITACQSIGTVGTDC